MIGETFGQSLFASSVEYPKRLIELKIEVWLAKRIFLDSKNYLQVFSLSFIISAEQ